MIIHRLSERPDLIDRVHEVDPNWPEFMGADQVMNAFFGQVAAPFPTCALWQRMPAARSPPPAGQWRLLLTFRVGAPCQTAA